MDEMRKNIGNNIKFYYFTSLFFIVFFNSFGFPLWGVSGVFELNLYNILFIFFPSIMLGMILSYIVKEKFLLFWIKVIGLVCIGIALRYLLEFKSVNFMKIFTLKNVALHSFLFISLFTASFYFTKKSAGISTKN